MQKFIDKQPSLKEIPRAQRRLLTRTLKEFEQKHPRNKAIALAYLSGQHTMAKIAEHFDVHYTTVSRIVSLYEKSQAE